jgi:hypothetical protein
MKATKKNLEQRARALFPRKDMYRNNDGHVKIWRPEGGWGWFASPGSTVVTPNLVVLAFPADHQRDTAQARTDLYHQLENAALTVISEAEIDAAMGRATSLASAVGGKIMARKIDARWQPVDSDGNVIRGTVYNVDGSGYSTKQGAVEAATMRRQFGERG